MKKHKVKYQKQTVLKGQKVEQKKSQKGKI